MTLLHGRAFHSQQVAVKGIWVCEGWRAWVPGVARASRWSQEFCWLGTNSLEAQPPMLFSFPDFFCGVEHIWRFDCCESQKAYHRKSGRYYAKAFSKPLPPSDSAKPGRDESCYFRTVSYPHRIRRARPMSSAGAVAMPRDAERRMHETLPAAGQREPRAV